MNHFVRPWCPQSLRGTITQANPQNQRRDAVTVHVEAASQQAEVRPTGTTCSPPSIPPLPLYQLPNTYSITHCHSAFTEPLGTSLYLKDRETKFTYTKSPPVNCTEHLKAALNFGKPEALQWFKTEQSKRGGALPDGIAGKIRCRRRKF